MVVVNALESAGPGRNGDCEGTGGRLKSSNVVKRWIAGWLFQYIENDLRLEIRHAVDRERMWRDRMEAQRQRYAAMEAELRSIHELLADKAMLEPSVGWGRFAEMLSAAEVAERSGIAAMVGHSQSELERMAETVRMQAECGGISL